MFVTSPFCSSGHPKERKKNRDRRAYAGRRQTFPTSRGIAIETVRSANCEESYDNEPNSCLFHR
jgi:hypothetical protein